MFTNNSKSSFRSCFSFLSLSNWQEWPLVGIVCLYESADSCCGLMAHEFCVNVYQDKTNIERACYGVFPSSVYSSINSCRVRIYAVWHWAGPLLLPSSRNGQRKAWWNQNSSVRYTKDIDVQYIWYTWTKHSKCTATAVYSTCASDFGYTSC